MKWIDLPPVWLALHLAGVWIIAKLWPVPLGAYAYGGWALVLFGLFLMAAAVAEMGRARTTVIPHRQPQALVTSGIFRFSRNPIYLGDVLVLVGSTLILSAPLGLILVPVFAVILTRRFILPEEDRLRAGFGTAFDAWSRKTRRWL
ncbi:methyltransferase family protein [Anianabacter salinae]|uniref:methyltransferase family protein n=1 Tax=Anianabacter salinae TaxID=2851023 RepID=UPI00225DF78A|nr:isoprenylcysteine carboxylmethyltransferase family protein [Anianabacter salinae]MBV0911714.1 isoprenylcysteine carboxylmethyltransferase family protein [Anianabacter salinae]